MLRPVRVSRTTAACTPTSTPDNAKPATCGLPESSDFCVSDSVLPRQPAANREVATLSVTLTRENPGPGDRGVERHRRQLAGVRRVRPRDDEDRLRAVLPRGHRLVAQVGIARQDRARLLIRVLGEVPQHQDDLVLHIERGVAVVPEVLAVGHDDAVAGEDDGPAHVAVVRKGQGARIGRREGRASGADRRPAVPRAGGELERRVEVAAPGQRLRADAFQLRDDELPGERFALGARHPAAEAFGGQCLHVRAELVSRLLLDELTAAADRANASRNVRCFMVWSRPS